MFGNNEYVGLAIQDDVIRVARVKVKGKSVKLIKLDSFTLVEKIKPHLQEQVSEESESIESFEDKDMDSIFGFKDDIESEQDEEEIDLEELEAEVLEDGKDDFSLDMVEESETSESNELVLYNILTDINRSQVYLGLNIPAGSTIFQFINDTNFKDVKKKDLVQDLEGKLESIYGTTKSSDNYSYEVRDDGSLILGSLDDESVSLQLTNKTKDFYSGKMMIESIIPDEMALVGLVRANYELEEDEITAVIQFGKEICRIIFMKGDDIFLISPIINEGTGSKSFLNTVFSKILFQLDTGEVTTLDQIILANNTIGHSAVEFFMDNFPDVQVEDLSFNSDLIDSENVALATIPSFTTAIGVALSATRLTDNYFPKLSFIPKYVEDRQKVFKLQWHGVVMLLLIFLTPITINYFYSKNARHIESMTNDLNQMNNRITQITPTVDKANELSDNMAILKSKLTLLDTLSQGTREWSVKLGILNQGLQNVRSSWITSMSQSKEGTFLQGYTFYRNRVPQIVNIFEDATLLSVVVEEMREKEVFSFSLLVKKFVKSDSVYAPSKPQEVKELIDS